MEEILAVSVGGSNTPTFLPTYLHGALSHSLQLLPSLPAEPHQSHAAMCCAVLWLPMPQLLRLERQTACCLSLCVDTKAKHGRQQVRD